MASFQEFSQQHKELKFVFYLHPFLKAMISRNTI